MKFRLVLILALLLGVAALSGLTARVHITVSAPVSSPTAYVRAFWPGQPLPPLRTITLPNPMGRELIVDFELSDAQAMRTVFAELYANNQVYTTSAPTVWPITHLYFNL